MNSNLELPYIALVPYAVNSSKLSSSEKLYFGSLAALSKKEGYCWATDKELSVMHGKSISQIKRWNRSLKKNGFIEAITVSVPYRDEKNRLLWSRKRKIYVNEGFSKNVCDRVINDPLIDRVMNEPLINNKTLKKKPPTLPSSKSPMVKRDPPKPAASVLPAKEEEALSNDLLKRLKKHGNPGKKLLKLIQEKGESEAIKHLEYAELAHSLGKVKESVLSYFFGSLSEDWKSPSVPVPDKKKVADLVLKMNSKLPVDCEATLEGDTLRFFILKNGSVKPMKVCKISQKLDKKLESDILEAIKQLEDHFEQARKSKG